MVDVKTEGQHREEFLLTEVSRDLSRESGTLKSGQNVVDGQVVKDDGTGKLVAAAGTTDSAGDSAEDIRGCIVGNWNVTADTPVVVVERLAVVKAANVKLNTHADGAGKAAADAAVKAALAKKFIVLR